MRIPDEKVEEVRAASDILDVVGEYVKLKRRGANFFGLCPFHNEKSPSFSVNPGMAIFKCFGCHEGGDVFSFVSKIENLGFLESVRLLADRAGVVLPDEEGPREDQSEVDAIYHALRFAARWFYRQLTATDDGKTGLDYLLGRGFTPATIKGFGLGYAPDRWDGLLQAAEAEHVEAETLEKAGLVLPRRQGDGYYDRFRGRVVFPIFSHVGKVVGFGGRILESGTDQPKYINSPETKVYTKSRVLYGLYQGKQEIRRSNFVTIVEGYTDVISLHQRGIKNVVSTSGTALTSDQGRLLKRYAKKAAIIFDGDSAGASSMMRGADVLFQCINHVYMLELPKGEDPDSFAKKRGPENFVEYLRENWINLPAFKIKEAKKNGSIDDPLEKSSLINSMMLSVSKIEDKIIRDEYVMIIANAMSVPDIYLFEIMDKYLRGKPEGERGIEASGKHFLKDMLEEGSYEDGNKPSLPEEKILLRLMLEHGVPLVELILGHMALDEFTEGPSRDLVEALLAMYQADDVDTRRFFDDTYGGAVQRLAAEVMVDRYAPSENWELRQNIPVPRLNEDPYEVAAEAMTLLKLDRVDEAIADHKRRLQSLHDPDEATMRRMQEEIMALHGLRKHIQQRGFLRPNAA